MKRLVLLLMVLLCAVSYADYAPGLYLQVTQTVVSSDPLDIYVPVTDKADAEAKLPAVLAEHFSGKSYEAFFHQHYLDKPCVWELIATGTQP